MEFMQFEESIQDSISEADSFEVLCALGNLIQRTKIQPTYFSIINDLYSSKAEELLSCSGGVHSVKTKELRRCLEDVYAKTVKSLFKRTKLSAQVSEKMILQDYSNE